MIIVGNRSQLDLKIFGHICGHIYNIYFMHNISKFLLPLKTARSSCSWFQFKLYRFHLSRISVHLGNRVETIHSFPSFFSWTLVTFKGGGDVNTRRRGQNASPSGKTRVTSFRSIHACISGYGGPVIASRSDISIRLIGRRRRRRARSRMVSSRKLSCLSPLYPPFS